MQHCGIDAFENGGGGKVGECFYIGTALDQISDSKVRALCGVVRCEGLYQQERQKNKKQNVERRVCRIAQNLTG